MKVGVPREVAINETRVAMTPEVVAKLCAKGFEVQVEKNAGDQACYSDVDYQKAGANLVNHDEALAADVIFKIGSPSQEEIAYMKPGAVLLTQFQGFDTDKTIRKLADTGVISFALERVPRISRAQNVDVLSSQSNIAGYRAALKAAELYGSFFPMMMTSAGTARPAKVMILGAGVAGLQAIATAKKLGAKVFAYDLRPEVKEQCESLGATFVEFELGEEGNGEGGYAKQLSKDAQKRQQQLMSEKLQDMDVIISTALIPGRPAPVLITEETVKGMRYGSVIIDMAAIAGGNCPLTEPDKTIVRHGVKICGITNYPAQMPTDASAFYARNLFNFLSLLVTEDQGRLHLKDYDEDEITAASIATRDGKVC